MRRPRAWALGLVAAISLAFLASLAVLVGPDAGWLWALGIGVAALVGVLLFASRDSLPEGTEEATATRPNDQVGNPVAPATRRDDDWQRAYAGVRRGEVDDGLDDADLLRHA